MSNIIVMNNPYKDDLALYNVMHYCVGDTVNSLKCQYWGGYGVPHSTIDAAIAEMNYIKQIYNKTGGKALCHFVVTLCRKTESHNKRYLEGKLEKERRECDYFSERLSYFLYMQGYQHCYFKHVDSNQAHVHYVLNSVNFRTGMKINNISSLAYAMRDYLNSIFYLTHWKNVLYRKGEDFDY